MWQRRVFTFYLGLVGGCSGGQSGDPGFGSETPDITPATDCEVTDRLRDEPQASTSRCQLEDDSEGVSGQPVAWSCECGDTPRSVSAPYCHNALREACDVDAFAATFCEAPLGTCFPEDTGGSQWSCSCAQGSAKPGVEVSTVTTDNCYDAASIACGQTCESDVGSCTMMNEGEPQRFECACSRLSGDPGSDSSSSISRGPTVASSGQTCEAALEATCGGSCETESGSCTYEGEHFTCSCNDDKTIDVDLTTLLDADLHDARSQCQEAVGQACGFVTMGETCSSETSEWSATCTSRASLTFSETDAATNPTFDCECVASSSHLTTEPDAGSSMTAAVEAPNCDNAVATACPGAVRTGTDPNGATLDYGHLCTADEECSGGACYVPGTRVNPICSKHCETDADCPDFSNCVIGAGGYCFVRCTSDQLCLELNPAVTNALYCSTDFPEVGSDSEPGICVQASEP